MGLGKTIQIIAMFAYLSEYRNVTGPFLIIAPLTVLCNWKRELNKWTPFIRAVVLPATFAEREEIMWKGKLDGID